jgi:hypothetical protein
VDRFKRILRRHHSFIWVITAALFFAGSAVIVSAFSIEKLNVTEEGDFIVEPGKMEAFINPGDTITKYVTVTSRSKTRVEFSLSVEDFIGSRDPNNPVLILEGERSPRSFKDHVKADTNAFGLEFGEKITIPITVTAPGTTEPGGYFIAILISNAPSQLATSSSASETGAGARIVSRVGSLMFIRVNGPAEEAGQLTDFKVQGPARLLHQSQPNGFEILYENTGTVHLVPYGIIDVKNIFGKTVSTLPINAYFSLPDSVRYRQIEWASKGFRLGRYSATLNLHRGYDDLVDTKKIAFWIIPWKFILIFVVAIAIVVTLVYFITTRFEFRRKK